MRALFVAVKGSSGFVSMRGLAQRIGSVGNAEKCYAIWCVETGERAGWNAHVDFMPFEAVSVHVMTACRERSEV
jgi:hypothetical protein